MEAAGINQQQDSLQRSCLFEVFMREEGKNVYILGDTDTMVTPVEINNCVEIIGVRFVYR